MSALEEFLGRRPASASAAREHFAQSEAKRKRADVQPIENGAPITLAELRGDSIDAGITNTMLILARHDYFGALHGRFDKQAIVEYARFVALKVVLDDVEGPQLALSPSAPVDKVWRKHMLAPSDYVRMNEDLFDRQRVDGVLHSVVLAYKSTRNAERYARTLDHYRSYFRAEPPAQYWPVEAPAPEPTPQDAGMVRVHIKNQEFDRYISFVANVDSTIDDVSRMLRELTGRRTSGPLYQQNVRLSQFTRLNDESIDLQQEFIETFVEASVFEHKPLHVIVKLFSEKLLHYVVYSDDKVSVVKTRISENEGFPYWSVELVFNGKKLSDDVPLSMYRIVSESTLYMIRKQD